MTCRLRRAQSSGSPASGPAHPRISELVAVVVTEVKEPAYLPPGLNCGSPPGDRILSVPWARWSNSAGTAARNRAKVAARDSAKTFGVSPTCSSNPSAACSRRAIFSTKASTRVVFPLN